MTMSTARPADPPDYPRDGTFADLLKWHSAWGTRPGCSITSQKENRRWKKAEITAAVYALSTTDPKDRETLVSAEKTIGNWRRDKLPDEKSPERVDRLFHALFSDDEALRHWKADLENALENDREARARAQARPKQRQAPEPPAREATAVPFSTDHLVGRVKDLDALSDMLASGAQRAILIQGGPGIGKTELAKAVAHHEPVVARFGDRRWFVSLGTATTASTMRDAIISALGGEPALGLRPVLDMLAEAPGLLVLDDLETPWEIVDERRGVEAILSELVQAPGLSLLGSFRGRDQMKEPRWKRHPVEALDTAAAKELFERIADRLAPDDPRLDDFIEALGGVPLAIHLLAHRASGRADLASLWREWQERGVDILHLPGEPVGTQSSFSQSIMQSLDSIRTMPDARRLFSMLGQLPDSILEEQIPSIIGPDALDAVDSLLHVGLVVENSGRIELLPPVKDYAHRKTPTSDEDEMLIREHYLRLIAKLGMEVGTVDDWDHIPRIEAEMPNIEWAFLRAATDGKSTGVGEALRGLSRFLSISSYEIRIFRNIDYEKKLNFDRSDIFSWSYVNIVTGDINFRNGDLEVARAAFYRGALFLDASKFPKLQAEALIKGAEVDRLQGRYDNARDSIKKAREIYQELNDHANRPSEAHCFPVLARIHLDLGEYEEASLNFGWAAVYSNDHDIFVRTLGCKGMGDVKLAEGDLDYGRDLIEEALVPFRGMGCRLWEARCIEDLGRVDLREGKYDPAQSKLEEALAIYRQIGDASGEADAKFGLVEVERLRATPAAPEPTAE